MKQAWIALFTLMGCVPEPTAPVQTESGLVRGLADPATGVAEFLGIPYARVGTRFAPPDDAQPWEGVRDAYAYGPACTEEEDCLNLNIWAPQSAGPHPVMVWIHGGGFIGGTANTEVSNGKDLAATGSVVVISLNYRLGAPGFLLSADGLEGNYGMRDQVRALQWVEDNIAAFGGDPDNVTIFGESAGGMSVCTLLGIPAADDLFDRAIIQSGPCDLVPVPDEPYNDGPSVLERHERIIEAVGCADADDRIACLREPARFDALNQAAAIPILPIPPKDDALITWPVLDGTFVTASGYRRIADGDRADLPLIVGYTDQEFTGASLIQGVFTQAQFEAQTQSIYGAELGAQLTGLYTAAEFGSPGAAFDRMLTEVTFQCPALAMADAAADGAHPSYLYNFRHSAALHGLDVAYLFGGWLPVPGASAVTDAMQYGWTSFARSGNPGDGAWPAHDPAALQVAAFDDPLAIESEVAGGRCAQLAALIDG